jgi:hypothetical protein
MIFWSHGWHWDGQHEAAKRRGADVTRLACALMAAVEGGPERALDFEVDNSFSVVIV